MDIEMWEQDTEVALSPIGTFFSTLGNFWGITLTSVLY